MAATEEILTEFHPFTTGIETIAKTYEPFSSDIILKCSSVTMRAADGGPRLHTICIVGI